MVARPGIWGLRNLIGTVLENCFYQNKNSCIVPFTSCSRICLFYFNTIDISHSDVCLETSSCLKGVQGRDVGIIFLTLIKRKMIMYYFTGYNEHIIVHSVKIKKLPCKEIDESGHSTQSKMPKFKRLYC